MDVHASLLPVCYAENVDAPRPDGQGSRQEVPERLQSTLPLDVRVDKSSRCYAFRRQERERENCSVVDDTCRVDESLPVSGFHTHKEVA